MDDLALNIFIPEERKKPQLRKPNKSPTHTVVKSSAKAGKVVKKSLEKISKLPIKSVLHGTKKQRNDQSGAKDLAKTVENVRKLVKSDHDGSKESARGVQHVKKTVNSVRNVSTKKPPSKPAFIRPKLGKPNTASKPFLVSEAFKKLPTAKEHSKDNDDAPESFTVSFVKPKLFRSKAKVEKPREKRGEPEGDNKDGPNTGRFEAKEGPSRLSAAPDHPPGKSKEPPAFDVTPDDEVAPVRKAVDFPGSADTKFVKSKGPGNVFAPQTFKKWSIKSDTNQKVHIDFSTGVRSESKSTVEVPSSTLRRKSDSANEDLVVKRKKRDFTAGNVEKLNENKSGDKTRWSSGFHGENDEAPSDLPKKSGPKSSLFNGAPEVERLEEPDVEPVEERLFSRKQFADVGVHPHLVGNLEQLFGITKMTVVQKKTIPVLMSGKDALVRSQTGSGKTLAYAVPIMHSLAEIKPQLTRKDGVKALVVLPTRELALQTYECFLKLMRAFTWIVPGIVVGGENRKREKTRLRKGITVLVGTPGRLLDHAQHTDNLNLHGIDWLVIDEADKLLEMGYEKDVSSLMSIIDGQREKSDAVGRKQTVLLSATLTSSVERLANLALKDPVRVDACTEAVAEDVLVIPTTLEQKYVVVPAKMRLVALASFLIDVAEWRKSNKILVFMATQDMVDFYLELLQGVLSSSVKFYKLHGNMSQTDRTEVFNRFRNSDKGVLLSTDVAARGLDLPKVDWIVQFTAPTTPSEYVHRVGRTARVGTYGSALLFLLPSELHFVSMLNSSRIKLGEASLDQYLKSLMKINLESKDGQRWGGGVEGAATVLQHNFEHAVLDDSALHELAAKAYKSWVRFYATYPKDLRVVFDFKSLHLGHNAKSFALRDPPRAIGGIGKPKKGDKPTKGGGRIRKDDRRKRKSEGLGHVTSCSRTKKLILSEFDSGLKPSKKT